jgi:hypothetical protein
MPEYNPKKRMRKFNKMCKRCTGTLVDKLGEDKTEDIISQARKEYELIIPEIPFIGTKTSQLRLYLLISAECLAFFKAMEKKGIPANESKKIMYSAAENIIESLPIPGSIARFFGRMTYTKLYRKVLRSEAKAQDRLPKEINWPFTVLDKGVDKDGTAFDYGFDYRGCAIKKFYERMGAGEYTDFMCSLDWPVSRLMAMGLRRKERLTNGDKRCSFRYIKGSGEEDNPL